MTEKLTALCPCQSGQRYQACCQPYHQQQQFPANAMLLMRSRYAAYALKNIDYIVQTTVPNQQALLPVAALQDWADKTTWVGLDILQHVSLSKTHSQVEFKAFFAQQNQTQVHHEISLFVNIAQRWYFVDPTVTLPNMKQPCLCGSNKKFKHCCGGLL
ncbi:SEC-C motif-containing protein [Pasteurella multocida]|uniref:YchJ family protein n=1 Tax=Pasteurella multocida TaxID=747 RepID=UPI0008E6D751|nr:YchJ family protein [Pasteurella multocida]APW56356.1 SEC-C motif protein [Pasteurella multocida subsp. multocida str. HN07]ARA69923.1 SEC-C motif-containing protein [Pasteurella multocida subsp. multocida]ARA90057.1 SEC-C motif-containing protein [Pasteurella multocida subsp. septica]AUL54135.1 preprotein translocase subunit SecA [Pasteurella multocida]MBE7394785.1 YchJ family protein [Pasteurella multocida]